mmetsp:Transcript_39076/g.78847  ORF Transcript_39076/g.78847 Transcript_39076/m.78847 type:complete len:262 (+) Transcript_39076:70-855(+)
MPSVSARLAPSAAESLFTAAPGCHTLLQDIAAQGRSDMELAAYCRANMPPQFCRDAAGSLGSQPWSSDRMVSTCQKWEEQWNARVAAEAPGRAAMDFAEMQAKADQCVKAKALAGLCKDPKTGGPLPVDKCVAYKAKVYPEQTKKWHDTLQAFYGVWMGKGQQAAPPTTTKAPAHGLKGVLGAIGSAIAKGKQQKSEQVGPVAVPSMVGSGFFVGAAVAAAAFAAAAGVVTFSRFWRRAGAPEHSHVLVSDSPENAAPSDA